MYTIIILYLHLPYYLTIVTLYLIALVFLLLYEFDSGILHLGDWVLRTCHSRFVNKFCTQLFLYNYLLTRKIEYEPLSIQYDVWWKYLFILNFRTQE